AEACELGHVAFNQIADLIFLIDVLPRIVAQLFDAETDPLIRLIDIDNFGFDFVAFLKDFARMIDFAGPTQIRNVDHSVDTFIQFNERAVSSHVPDGSFDAAANGELLLDLVPRIRFELTQAQRNFLLFLINAEHYRFDFLTNRQNIGWSHDSFRPRKFRNVNETFDAFLEFHERSVGN